MAYGLVFLSFLLIICMSSMANCDLLDGGNTVDRNIIADPTGIGIVRVFGALRRPIPPPTVYEPTLPAGTNVVLTCDGGRTVISDALTDTNGFFEITFHTLKTSVFHPSRCDLCFLSVRGTSAISCFISPGSRGALLAPVNCHDPVVERLHGTEQGHDKAIVYKAEPFYFDPSYHY